MTSPQSSPKPAKPIAQKGRHGIKALIAAASLTTTLGGWAMLSAERAPATSDPPLVASPTQGVAGSSDAALGLPPLPTLIPPPTGMPTLPALPTEVAQPLPQPTLRVVTAPPQRVVHVGGGGSNQGGAVAQTHSSR